MTFFKGFKTPNFSLIRFSVRVHSSDNFLCLYVKALIEIVKHAIFNYFLSINTVI